MSNDTPTGRPEREDPEFDQSELIDPADAASGPSSNEPRLDGDPDTPIFDQAAHDQAEYDAAEYDAEPSYRDAEPVEPAMVESPTVPYTPAEPFAPPAAEPTPLIEPEVAATTAAARDDVMPADAPAESMASQPAASQPITEVPEAADFDAGVSDAAVPDAAAHVPPPLPPSPQVVYVTQPTPPRPEGNRGFGVGFALLSTVVFAGVLAGVAALISFFSGQFDIVAYLVSPEFWAPVVVFAIAYIVVALIVNRAGWWAHVLGGFIVALLTYGGFLLGVWIAAGAWTELTASEMADRIGDLWFHPVAIATFIIAREVPIWLGAATGRRGRRVATRNVEARAAFDREQEAVRADMERRRQGLA